MQVSLFADTDYRLWVLLAQARDALLKARTSELAGYGVSAIEALALFVISDIGDGATPAELSRRMMRRHNTVSALLNRMEKKGLIAKVKDPDRKNIWRVSLTDRGEVACQHARRMESLHQAMSAFSDAEKRLLESYLRTMRDKALKSPRTESTIVLP